MSRKIFFVLLSLLTSFSAMCQLNPDSLESKTDPMMVLPAKLFTQFAQSVKPTSLIANSAAEEKTLLETAANTNDAAGVARNTVALAGLIKPELFKTGFSYATLKTNAAGVQSMQQAASLMKSLESGLKPMALTTVWKMQKTNWTNDLNTLK